MARQQYRVAGQLEWFSSSGNALLAIVNRLGSNRKVTLRSLEVTSLMNTRVGTVTASPLTELTTARATVAGGREIVPVPLDTDADAWPSSVRVLDGATTDSPEPLKRFPAFLHEWQSNNLRLERYTLTLRPHYAPRSHADVEQIVVREGEGLAVYVSVLQQPVPVRVSATLWREGSPGSAWTTTHFSQMVCDGFAVFAVQNDAGSGEVIHVRDIAVQEVGNTITPYLQLVPVGGLIDSDAALTPTILRLDPAHDDPLTHVEVKVDCPMLPFGVPEDALALSSAGSPKGFNYLKTKDFLGPVYRALFPEGTQIRVLSASHEGVLGTAHRNKDLLIRNGGSIVMHEGEGVALVSAAETAVATAAVGLAGMLIFDFAATFDVEVANVPEITLSGMAVGSRWRIERVSDGSEVGTGVTADGTGSVVYDADDTPLDLRLRVRKASGAPLYKPYEVEFQMTSSSVSIPVSQTLDT